MTDENEDKLKSLEQAVKDADQLRSSAGLAAVAGLFVAGPIGFAIGGNGYGAAQRLYDKAVRDLEEYKSKMGENNLILTQLIVNGLIAGAIYALMAASFSLIFNIVKFMDLSPGAIFVIAAFSAYAFNVLFGMNFIMSILLALIVCIFVTLVVNQIIYRPLRKNNATNFVMLLASFSVFLILTGLVLMIFGPDVKNFNIPTEKGIEILGFFITKIQIILIVSSSIMFVLLYCFTKYTKLGKAMRAMSDDRHIASTLGINTEKTIMITYIMASVLSGIAGILVGLEQNLEHSMGFSVILKGLTASVIGGIGNIPAALIGGFLIGVIENLGIWYLPSGFKDSIAFVILIIFLLIRPQGIFGVKTREEGSG